MDRKRLALLVGGGPAPGINSVIAAASIRASLENVDVLGIHRGFEGLMEGDASVAETLTIEKVSRIHFRGGSFIGISRANPTKDPGRMETTVQTLLRLGVESVITIGGDDTCFSALSLERAARGRLRVVHVPKSIDNDLDMPAHVDTFGYQTARHHGVEVVKNLMVDAKTTSRWYFVVAMGRKAGHLALGIGKAAGATLTLIPEEFRHQPVPLGTVADILVGAIVKRLALGREDGVAVIAEGVVLSVDPRDLAGIESAERDAHGHLRIAEVDFGAILKREVQKRMADLGRKTMIVDKNVGYELRSADPIPSDMEYTRDLGYCAAKYLLEGGTGVMITVQAGRFVPIPFAELVDPQTGRARVRLVDVESTRYGIARRYMIRLRKDDFEDAAELARIAEAARLTVEQFRRRFEYLTEEEPPGLVLPLVSSRAAEP